MASTDTTTKNPMADRLQSLIYSADATIASTRTEVKSLADGIARDMERIVKAVDEGGTLSDGYSSSAPTQLTRAMAKLATLEANRELLAYALNGPQED